MKTLLFHHGALGDGILLWPLLRAMRQVVFVASGSRAALAGRWLGQVEAMDIDSPDMTRLFAPAGEMEVADSVRALLAGADRIISLVSDGHDAWAANVRHFAPNAQFAFVRPRPVADDLPRPVLAFIQQQLAEQGIAIDPVAPTMRANRQGPVVIHPGSGGRAKCWPIERFEKLFEHFRAMGREVVILIGEAETERMDGGVLTQWSISDQVICPPDLIALSQHIVRASVYIGNDCGPTHLAAQLGVATVAMFGPTDPRLWSPQGPAVRVLAPPTPQSMDWLSVEQVAQAAAMWG